LKVKFIMVLILIAGFTTFFSTSVFLLDQELPTERFRILGDKLYIYAVNFLETIDADFSWNNSSKSIDIQIKGNSVRFFNNSSNVEINGKNVSISTPPTIINGRFFLPLIDSCKIFGLRMVTDGENYKVYKDGADLQTYFWIPDGLALNFDKAVSFVIKKHSNGLFIMDIIGTELENTVESYRFGNIKKFKIQNSNEDTMSNFIRLTLELKEDIKVKTELQNNTIWLRAVKEDPVNTQEKKGLKTVVIDPGHGGFDPGAIGVTGVQEKILALKVSMYLKDKLVEKGYKVFLTREDDSYIELQERCIFANKKKGDIFISIHMNSFVDDPSVTGAEVFYYKWSEESYKGRLQRIYGALSQDNISNYVSKKLGYVNYSEILAREIGKSIKENGVKLRKIIPEDYAVVAYTEMPAVLVECGYISNKEFENTIKKESELENYANYIFEGIENYFNLIKKED